MKTNELIKRLNDIADIGIVNAKKDVPVIREAAKALKKSDFQKILHIFNHCTGMIGHYSVTEDDGKFDLIINDHDQSIVLIFDEEGRLIG